MAGPAPRGTAGTALAAFRVYTQPRVAAFLFIGFASGLPLALAGATLAARLERAGVSLTEIGLISLVALAYSLKFFWAPVVDRMPLPLLTRWFVHPMSIVMCVMIVFGLSPESMTRPALSRS